MNTNLGGVRLRRPQGEDTQAWHLPCEHLTMIATLMSFLCLMVSPFTFAASDNLLKSFLLVFSALIVPYLLTHLPYSLTHLIYNSFSLSPTIIRPPYAPFSLSSLLKEFIANKTNSNISTLMREWLAPNLTKPCL